MSSILLDRFFKIFPLDNNLLITVFVIIVPVVAILFFLYSFAKNMIRSHKLTMPSVKGGWPFLGQVFAMVKGSPWDTMTQWVMEYGTIYKFHLFGADAVCVSDPTLLRVMLQTNMLTFKKDTEWTYKPFMVILGNGKKIPLLLA